MLSILLSAIEWNVSPVIFTLEIGDISLPFPWYGLLFAFSFLAGQYILARIFQKDQKPISDVYSLTLHMTIAIVIGARLGHFLFYEWPLLMSNPLEWLLVLITPPFRGLASHGATIGMFVALYLYSRTRPDQPFLWITDRLIIPVALGAAFIRMGNLFNSEIYGKPTDLPWGFLFLRETDPVLVPIVPRHPTQLYEALFYLLLFAGSILLWRYKRHIYPNGFPTGLFLTLLFGFRFLIEFLKNNQSGFENSMSLNMGQLLSLPAILAGIGIILFTCYKSVLKVSTSLQE